VRRHEAVRRVRKPQVEHAGIGLVSGYGGDRLHGTRDGRQDLVTVPFEDSTKRLAQDPVVVTQNKPHRPRSFWPIT
jgi:hypothetical protein